MPPPRHPARGSQVLPLKATLGICPLSLSTHEAGTAPCFSQNTKFCEHMNRWHMALLKKNQTNQTNQKIPLESCQLDRTHWFQHTQTRRPRTSRWHCACSLDRPGKQAVTVMFPIPQAIKTPVLSKGMTLGFPVQYVLLLLTEITPQVFLFWLGFFSC